MESSARQLSEQKISWRRIEGVNGWRLSAEEIANVYDQRRNALSAKHPLVKAEIGCYLSHIAAWRAIAAGKAPGGFVFEDDFAADRSLGRVMSLLSADRGHWDMAKLFSFKPEPRLLDPRPLGMGHRIGTAYRVPSCTIAYVITRGAAARLAARAIPFFRPVDEDLKFFWENGLRIALVTPPPITEGEQQAAMGTIGKARRQARHEISRGALRQTWSALAYQVDYSVRLRFNRLRGVGR